MNDMVQPDSLQPVGEQLAAVAKGEIPLAEIAGLSAEQLALALQFAMTQMQTGNVDHAVAVIKGLIAFDEQNPIFHQYLGICLERREDLSEAIAAYDANLSLLERLGDGARLAEGFVLRARAHALNGDQASAKADIETAKTHNPGNDPDLDMMIRTIGAALAGGNA